MPVYEYVCSNCKEKTEVFVRKEGQTPVCKKCGAELTRVYSGKMFGATGAKSGGCTGNCATCSGCK